MNRRLTIFVIAVILVAFVVTMIENNIGIKDILTGKITREAGQHDPRTFLTAFGYSQKDIDRFQEIAKSKENAGEALLNTFKNINNQQREDNIHE